MFKIFITKLTFDQKNSKGRLVGSRVAKRYNYLNLQSSKYNLTGFMVKSMTVTWNNQNLTVLAEEFTLLKLVQTISSFYTLSQSLSRHFSLSFIYIPSIYFLVSLFYSFSSFFLFFISLIFSFFFLSFVLFPQFTSPAFV